MSVELKTPAGLTKNVIVEGQWPSDSLKVVYLSFRTESMAPGVNKKVRATIPFPYVGKEIAYVLMRPNTNDPYHVAVSVVDWETHPSATDLWIDYTVHNGNSTAQQYWMQTLIFYKV